MNAAEVLRSIRYDWLSYIQEKVRVDFDNMRQMPVHFIYRTRAHFIRDVLGRFRIRDGSGLSGFLVKADNGEVYFLYFHGVGKDAGVDEGYWVLSFRVLNDRELMAFYRNDRKMLLNMTVKRVVDFHGHLCPELAIGMKACEYARKLLFGDEEASGHISVLVENCTSALDALQVLLGATVGNQRLKVLDFGKHNYTFSDGNANTGFTLRFKGHSYGDEHEYEILEEKIARKQISLDEVVRFQALLDGRVLRLLASSPEGLFDMVETNGTLQTTETPAAYLSCAGCGQHMLKEHAVEFQGQLYCAPCREVFQRPMTGHSLN